jgi:hypothetical protein
MQRGPRPGVALPFGQRSRSASAGQRTFRPAQVRPLQVRAALRDPGKVTIMAIARGSSFECLAILDLLDLEAEVAGSDEARAILLRLMAVLTALIRR